MTVRTVLLVLALLAATALVMNLVTKRRDRLLAERAQWARLQAARAAAEQEGRQREAAQASERERQERVRRFEQERRHREEVAERERAVAAQVAARARLADEARRLRDRARWNPEERAVYEEFLLDHSEQELREAGAFPDLQGRDYPDWLRPASTGRHKQEAERARRLWDMMVHARTPLQEAESARANLLKLCRKNRWPTDWSDLALRFTLPHKQ